MRDEFVHHITLLSEDFDTEDLVVQRLSSREAVNELFHFDLMVIGHDEPKLLAINRLDEPISASAALAGKDLLLRGSKHLYCLADSGESDSQLPQLPRK